MERDGDCWDDSFLQGWTAVKEAKTSSVRGKTAWRAETLNVAANTRLLSWDHEIVGVRAAGT